MGRTSGRSHWDSFWRRDRPLAEIYDNGGRLVEEISSIIEVRGSRILEVGAATARDTASLAGMGASSVALDYSRAALALAREACAGTGAMLVCGDASELPFRDGVFDLVFHQGVLEHFRDPSRILAENARVAAPGGLVLADVPQTFHVYTLFKHVLIALGAWFAGWETQYSRRGLERLMRSAGLRPVAAYGRFMTPSLAYRILREAAGRIGIRLPLRPVLLPALHSLRARIRRRAEHLAGPLAGYVIGVFGRRPTA